MKKSSDNNTDNNRATTNPGGGQLLQELEALSHALYKAQVSAPPPSAPPPRREFDQLTHRRRVSEAVGSRPKQATPSPLDFRHSISAITPSIQEQVGLDVDNVNVTNDQDINSPIDLSERKKKKGGFWNWKPLRALAHIGQQRFHCEFSAHVHGVEKLPPSMNGLRLQIQLRHRDTGVQTMPARVQHNCAEFEEILHFRCTVYGSKRSSGGYKYLSKSFTLSVVAMDVEELEFGKHQLDLSRILPSNSAPGTANQESSTWNTSFNLSGKAKGSLLWITFSYELVDNRNANSSSGRFGQSPAIRSGGGASRSFNSLPNSPSVPGGGGKSFTGAKSSGGVMDFGSPAMSEPGHDYSDFQMEQFSLDDEPPAVKAPKVPVQAPPGLPPVAPVLKPSVNLKSMEFVEHRGKPLFSEVPVDPAIAPQTPVRSQEVEHGADEEGGGDDNIGEYNIVEKGTETSALDENEYSLRDEDLPGAQQEEEREPEREEEEEDLEEERDLEEVQEDIEQPEAPTYHQLAEGDVDVAREELEQEEMETEQEDLPPALGRDYDWRQELEEDDLFDTLRNPGTFEPGKAPGEAHAVASSDDDELEAAKELLKANDEAELVTDEFLDMLGTTGSVLPEKLADVDVDSYSNEEPDSPRALLLKQFEQEALLEGGFGIDLDEAAELAFGVPNFNLDEDEELPSPSTSTKALLPSFQASQRNQTSRISTEDWSSDEDKELAAIMDAAESELQKATQAMRSKARAKMLEDAEAEALLQEWGLNEQVFHDETLPGPDVRTSDLSDSNVGAVVVRQGLPALAPGLGVSVPTADGGSLRSMDPSHFQTNGKSNGNLVMHVSKPVVVPSEMGSSAMEVLQNLTAAGTETMAAEAMAAMPLEDITGKSVQQIALEGQVSFEESSRRYDSALLASNYALEDGSSSSGALTLVGGSPGALMKPPEQRKRRNGAEFLQLDELAPVAMEKIEELAMQGLKIQSDMADEDAPYVLEAGKSVPLLTGGSATSSSDGMISMSLTLDEWMRLDAGLADDEEASEKSKAIMAAHREAHTTADLVLNLTGDSEKIPEKGGKMGDTLTLAMLVQLRDPLRNYEPVGAPMMALVEAERVMVPPRPKMWKRVALKGNSEVDEEDSEKAGEEVEEAGQPQFKITGVHMAGLSVQEETSREGGKKKQQQAWGNQRQQQSGSRWLVANGMGKPGGSKHPLLRSGKGGKGKESSSSSLWSISARQVDTPGAKSLVRNPDVKFGKKR